MGALLTGHFLAPKSTKKATAEVLKAIEANLEAIESTSGDGVAKKKAKTKSAKPAPKPKKLSAIDAVAQVHAASKEPMNTREMIDAMTAKSLWTSPGGKTPLATLYSAILREIATGSIHSGPRWSSPADNCLTRR
jgi:hypothetical protein